MMKVEKVYQRLACAAAAVSALCVLLAIISRFTGATIVVTQSSYMSLATVAILFAIYFLIEGAVYSAKKAK